MKPMQRRKEDYGNMVQRLYKHEVEDGSDLWMCLCRTITFQVTSGCNLCCSCCYEHHKGIERMTLETGKRIVDYFLDMYKRGDDEFINRHSRGVVLDFIGGEPLLEAELIEHIVDYWFVECYRRNIPLGPFTRISFATNGQLWFSDAAQHLFEKYHELMSITVSIDGVQELHDAFRVDKEGKGSFERAYRAFQDGKKYGWYNSKMTFVPGSFKYISDSVIMMLNEGCTEIACNYAFEPLYTPEDGRLLYEQLKIVSDYIIKNKLDVTITILDPSLGGKANTDNNFCGGTGAMLSFAPDGSAYPCVRYAPISIGDEKAQKVRFGSIYDGLYVTEEQRKVKNDLDAITLTSQSAQECIDCPISANCGWCSGLNYEIFGTANKRLTNICWAHKARTLAACYYYNSRYVEIGDCLPITVKLAAKDISAILTPEQAAELRLAETDALVKFATEHNIGREGVHYGNTGC